MVKIRKAKLKDIPEIVELRCEFMCAHDKKVVESNQVFEKLLEEKENTKEIVEKDVRKWIRGHKSRLLVAEEDGKLVGYCRGSIKDAWSTSALEKTGYVHHLYVKEGFRKKGIASEFMKQIENWFISKNLKYVSLHVFCKNDVAKEFYDRKGWHDLYINRVKKLA